MSLDPAAAARMLRGDIPLIAETLQLHLDDCTIRIRSNSAPLLERLAAYFDPLTGGGRPHDLEVLAIQRPPLLPELPFRDWRRDPGKRGRKDACHDLDGGRLIHKVRTGMLFLQSPEWRIAAGPCLENDNQVINFINAQYMNRLQHRGGIVCHAAGLVREGRCLGIAGFSGGGKSTLMLHLLSHPGSAFLSNDRLFVCPGGDGPPLAAGVPKQPRVNPGTIVNDPMLRSLIPAAEQARLRRLPGEQLWTLEQKYDVMVEQVYGPGRQRLSAPLGCFLILNWRRDSGRPLRLLRVDLERRRDLLPAIMKSPGPFYQREDGSLYQDHLPCREQTYLEALRGVPVFEVSGGVDFGRLTRHCLQQLWPAAGSFGVPAVAADHENRPDGVSDGT